VSERDEAPVQDEASASGGWTPRRHFCAWAGLLVLYFFISTYCLSRLPLQDPDEPRYASAGRTMAEGGSWLIPEFNEEPRYNKPPLFYWLIAISHKILGPSEVSARVPSIGMGLLMLILTIWAGSRLYDPATGYAAGLVLSTTPLFMGLCRTCIIDQTLSTIVATGLFLLLLRLSGRLRWDPVVAVGGCMGLAFMAKGPAAALIVVVPFLFVVLFGRKEFYRTRGPLWASSWLMVTAVGLGWYAIARWSGGPVGKMPAFVPAGVVMLVLTVLYYGLRKVFTFPAWLLALGLALGLSVWWYLALWVNIGTERFSELLRFEILGRLSGKMHRESIAFYLYTFPLVFFPWSLALIAAVACASRRVTVPLPLAADDTKETKRSRRMVSDAFLVAWLAGVVLFFSIPGAKLATYVLPAMPAAALLTVRFLRRLRSEEEPVHRAWLHVTVGLGGVVVLALMVLPFFTGLLKDDARQVIQELPVHIAVVTIPLGLLTGGAWVAAVLTRRSRLVLVSVPAVLVLLVLIALPVVCERAVFLRTTRDLTALPEVRAYAREAVTVHTVGWEEEGLAWYLARGVHEVRKPVPGERESRAGLIQQTLDAHPPGRVLLFAHRRKLKKWFGGGWPQRVREVAGNPFVAVLLNDGDTDRPPAESTP